MADTEKKKRATPIPITSDASFSLDEIIGRSGLEIMGGRPRDEWMRELQGANGAKAYREMRDNDSGIGIIFFLMESLIRQAPYFVAPAKPDALIGSDSFDVEEAQRWADFVDSCMWDMAHPWSDLMSDAFSCSWNGWAFLEICYKQRRGEDVDEEHASSKYNDGLWSWAKIVNRGQTTIESWTWDDKQENVTGLKQRNVPQPIPIEKAMLFRLRSNNNNPEGISLLRNAYRAYRFMTVMQDLEAVVYERGPGLPIIYVPPELLSGDATAEQQSTLTTYQKLGAQIRLGARMGIVFPAATFEDGTPTGYKIEFISPSSMGSLQIREAIRDYRKEIFTSLAMSFMLMGQNEHGSFALASSHTDISAMMVGSILKSLLDVVNKSGVARLMKYNGVSRQYWPEIQHGDFEKQSLEELSSFFVPMVREGLISRDPQLEAFLRDKSGAPPLAAGAVEAFEEAYQQGVESMAAKTYGASNQQTQSADEGIKL